MSSVQTLSLKSENWKSCNFFYLNLRNNLRKTKEKGLIGNLRFYLRKTKGEGGGLEVNPDGPLHVLKV